jgi:hypothetical protein
LPVDVTDASHSPAVSDPFAQIGGSRADCFCFAAKQIYASNAGKLALHRLGRSGEAAEALRSAAEALDRWMEARYRTWPHRILWVDHQGATGDWPIAWWDWVECHFYYREACQLIEGHERADDARLHVLRARSLAGLRWRSQAVAEYEIALQLLPHDWVVRMEAHRCRGYLAAHRRAWPDAAREFASAAEFAPDESHLWRFRAVAHLAAGELGAYQQCCAAMLERFQNKSDAKDAENVVLACVMGRAAVSNWDGLLAIASTAGPGTTAAKYSGGQPCTGPATAQGQSTASLSPPNSSAALPGNGRSWRWPISGWAMPTKPGAAWRRPLAGSTRPTAGLRS